jgi:hypothetical protein
MASTKTKKKTEESTGLDKQIAVRLTADDHARLERLAVHLSVATIARAALLVGLDVIEEQPGVLLGEKPKRR